MQINWNTSRSDGSTAPMVYDYGNQGGYGGTVSNLLRAIPAIKTQFEGVDLGPQQAVASRLGQLSEAMYDPNNPIYRQSYRANLAGQQQNLAQAIAELQRQNRKATATGRTALISPERGGEAIFRQIMGGQQDFQRRAQEQTLRQLGMGANTTAAAYQPYATNAQQDYQNRQRDVSAFDTIGNLIGSLFGI